MKSHREIIEAWPSITAFADDLRVEHSHARTMKARSRIPARYWDAVIRKAAERGFKNISLALLTRLCGPEPRALELPETIPANLSQGKPNQVNDLAKSKAA